MGQTFPNIICTFSLDLAGMVNMFFLGWKTRERKTNLMGKNEFYVSVKTLCKRLGKF